MRHIHRCATKDCENYYVCTSRDCRLDWQCPTCEDNEQADDLTRQEAELAQHNTQPAH